MASKKIEAYTEHGTVFIPDDVHLDQLPPGATSVALRGYAYTEAVMLNGECIGWISKPSKKDSP